MPFDKDLFLAEYNALREEILKRIEIVHQLMAGILVAWTAVLSVALQGETQKNGRTDILLLYPLLALAIAYLWAFNNRAIILTGNYIRVMEKKAEDIGGGMGWERHVRGKGSGAPSAICIFVLTQIITICLAMHFGDDLCRYWLVISINVILCLLTGYFIWCSEKNVPFPEN